jgi:hypothetical protein
VYLQQLPLFIAYALAMRAPGLRIQIRSLAWAATRAWLDLHPALANYTWDQWT